MLEAILSNPGLIATAFVAVIAIIVLVWYSGMGGVFIITTILKSVGSYGYKALYPAIIVLRQKSPYKIAAVGLAFSNFFLYLYSFIQTGEFTLLKSAIKALFSTIVGGVNQITTGGWVILQADGDIIKIILALIMMVLGFATLSLWFIGWKMAKKRLPELTYYTLVISLLITGMLAVDGLNQIFEMTDLIQTTAETVQGNQSVNATQAAGEKASLESFSIFS